MCEGRGGRGYRDFDDERFERDRDRDRDRDRGRGGRDYGCRCEEPRRPMREPEEDCDCGCEEDEGSPFGFKRQFISKAEVIEAMEEYLTELENEAQGVREAIEGLRAELAAKAKGAEKKEEKEE